MGRKREEIEYKHQRDTELLKAFYACLGPGVTTKEAVRMAVMMPCSRFWVTPETAAKEISSLRRGHWYQTQKPKRMRMQRAYDIMVRCSGDYSIANVTEVVYSAAPQFGTYCREIYLSHTQKPKERERKWNDSLRNTYGSRWSTRWRSSSLWSSALGACIRATEYLTYSVMPICGTCGCAASCCGISCVAGHGRHGRCFWLVWPTLWQVLCCRLGLSREPAASSVPSRRYNLSMRRQGGTSPWSRHRWRFAQLSIHCR